MAIFKKNEPQPQKARDRATPPPRNVSGDAAISIIGQGMSVVGDITTEGIVRVEGRVRGTVQASKAVILGQGGVVDGNVLTEDAVIGGTVSGSIVAGNRLELQSTCLVRGEIRTRAEHLKLEEGARFAGQVQMIDEDEDASEATEGSVSGSTSGTNHKSAHRSESHPDGRTGPSSSPEKKADEKSSAPEASRSEEEARPNAERSEPQDEKKAEAAASQPAESGK